MNRIIAGNINVDAYRFTRKTDAGTMSLENMIGLTVRGLADQAKLTVEDYLNGHTIQEISDNVKRFAKSEDDVNQVIFLTVNHANNLILRYQKEGKNLDFNELLEIRKRFPQAPITGIVSYALAKKDPLLVNFAAKIIQNDLQGNSVSDPQIVFNPLQGQITYINKEELQAQDIFQRTNTEDQEFLKIRVNQNEIAKRETLNRLAHLEVNKQTELTTDPEAEDELKKLKYKSTFLVKT